jgi:prepilin-type N-terminal cleavage/methylation domain-containing protein
VIRPNDKGFTIIEILLSVVIGSVVTGALLQAMLIGLRTLDDTNARIAGSNDTQLVAGYFTSDVASAESVSTTGTTAHSAPSVNASGNNSELVDFWAVRGDIALTPPDGMEQVWDAAETSASPSSAFNVVMAREALPSSGASGTRVAESLNGTSSLAHAVSLAPALFSTLTRRAEPSVGRAPSATQFTLAKPTGWQNQDVVLAHLVVSGSTPTPAINAPGWTLLSTLNSGATVTSLVYKRTVANDPAGWTFSLPVGSVNRGWSGGAVAYSGAGTVAAPTKDVNPCGGDTPVLLLNWTDRGDDSVHQVSYNFQSTGGENQLERRHCSGQSGTPDQKQTLARNLSPQASASAACQPVGCARDTPGTSVSVTLTLSEPAPMHGTSGRIYQLRGTTRTNS